MTAGRAILHLDMDAFFASVEQLDNPALRGKPILVGSDRGRGVVTTASYEARPFGCHSAMPMAVAKRLCPHAIVVPTRFSRYRAISDQVFDILEQFSPRIQTISIDEAFMDVTGCERALGPPAEIAFKIKSLIASRLGLTASVGVSFNKFLAKLASDMEKPDGLTIISPEDVDRILPPLSVRKLWGVGPKTADRLENARVRTFADVRNLSHERLERLCGSDGGRLRELAFGRDERAVVPDREAKSVGHEQTFSVDLADRDDVRAVLLGQVEQVAFRLRRHNQRAGSLTLKIRNGAFQTITRSTTLASPTDTTSELWAAAQRLFDAWAETRFEPVRLIGASAGSLSTGGEQLPLFTDQSHARSRSLDRAIDQINLKFGQTSIHRAAGTPRRRKAAEE